MYVSVVDASSYENFGAKISHHLLSFCVQKKKKQKYRVKDKKKEESQNK